MFDEGLREPSWEARDRWDGHAENDACGPGHRDLLGFSAMNEAQAIRCPECGGFEIRSTPATSGGRFRVCDSCGHLWREERVSSAARAAAMRRPPLPRWTFEQAFEHFLRTYPQGFSDPNYARRERTWKWEKHQLWVNTLKTHSLQQLARSSPETVTHLIEKMLQMRNPMLHPQGEIVAMRDAVHRPALAVEYFVQLGEFLNAPVLTAAAFDKYVDAFTSLPLIGHGQLEKWTLVTFIPFLAQPSRHMFLKPMRTREVTRRFGKDILYSPAPTWDTYDRLLTFSSELLDSLRPHGAQDMIDVQSFIWAVTGS